jgi:hypothetical protein
MDKPTLRSYPWTSVESVHPLHVDEPPKPR